MKVLIYPWSKVDFLLQAESDYYREVHQLDLKFQKVYDEINKKRANILTGEYEPSGPEVIIHFRYVELNKLL